MHTAENVYLSDRPSAAFRQVFTQRRAPGLVSLGPHATARDPEERPMHRILFVCHGNICRSTMAQFVMEHLVRAAGREGEFEIDSAATSREEIGCPPHRGTVAKLRRMGVPVGEHRARQVRADEYGDWDLIVCMDEENLWGLRRIIREDPEGKVRKLLSFAGSGRDIADPWYTGNFDDTYDDVLEGCEALLAQLG